MTARLLFRAAGILIAIAGAIDPAITSERRVPAVVSVVAAGPGTQALEDRVTRALGDRFTIVRGVATGAAAVVSIGHRVPDGAASIVAPVFAVMSDRQGPRLRIEAIDAPVRAPVDSRVPLRVAIAAESSAGRQVEITVTAGGVAVDRVTRTIASDADRFSVQLTFLPAAEGLTAVRVDVRLVGVDGDGAAASGELAISCDRRLWRVLVFDAQPAWMSTFVRRALEDDPRFRVASRTLTARSVSSGTVAAPTRLAEPATLDAFDAVVVGSPDALTDESVTALMTYLRRRGGGVVALMDAAAQAPAPFDRLSGVTQWTSETAAAPMDLMRPGAAPAALRASEVRSPAQLPPGAEVLLARDATRPPVVWQTPVGAGRLVLSGALDAWRLRRSAGVSFDAFWRDTVAAVAAGTPPAIDLQIGRPVAAPGEDIRAHVTLTSAALSPLNPLGNDARIAASVTASMDGPSGSSPVRFWPSGAPGEFEAVVPAAGRAGVYRMTVSDGATSAQAQWIVAADRRDAVPDQRDAIAALATSHGGTVIQARQLGNLAAAIDAVVPPVHRDTRWHPMRQPWWIAPFAACLGIEWWMRRRAGLA